MAGCPKNMPWNKLKRSRPLPGRRFPGVPVDKLFQKRRKFSPLLCATFPQIAGDVLRNLSAPAFYNVEAHDENRVIVLALEQIVDDCLKIGVSEIALSPSL